MSAAAEITWTTEDPKSEFYSLFRTAPLALAHCQDQGDIISLNPALQRLTGIGTTSSRALRLSDLVHPDDRVAVERFLAEMSERKRESFQIRSRSLDAGKQTLLWTVWRLSISDPLSESLIATAVPALESPISDQRLRQAERMETFGRLAGGVAHDFNNLLTGVLLYCDLLIASLEPGHRARRYADEIRKAGTQASGLVRQLLAIARPGNSQPQPISLNEIANGMRNLLTRLSGENIALKLQLDPALELVRMDPTQAQQILLNLVLNARDAMPRGGEITIETRNCKVQVLTDSSPSFSSPDSLPCALLVVKDTGDGMDAATRAHVFEPFFTTKGSKGNGLGLTTVHDIVVTSGGLIHVSSEPGNGTRIGIFLPLVPACATRFERDQDFHPVADGKVHSSEEEE